MYACGITALRKSKQTIWIITRTGKCYILKRSPKMCNDCCFFAVIVPEYFCNIWVGKEMERYTRKRSICEPFEK